MKLYPKLGKNFLLAVLCNFWRYNLYEMYHSSHLEREVGINSCKYFPGVSLNAMSSGKAVMLSAARIKLIMEA